MTNLTAFPLPSTTYPNGDFQDPEFGMTLRDYFAARVLPTVVDLYLRSRERPKEGVTGAEIRAAIASDAYAFADAMLKVREAQ